MHLRKTLIYSTIATMLFLLYQTQKIYGAQQPIHNQQSATEQFFAAFYNNDLDAIKLLISHGSMDINGPILYGEQTPLMFIIMEQHIKNYSIYEPLLELLITHPSCNVNQQSHGGKTALMFAAQYGNLKTFELLLDHKANPILVDKDGNNALSCIYHRYQQKLDYQQQAGELGGCISAASCDALDEDRDCIMLLLKHMIGTVRNPEEQKRRLEKIIQATADRYSKDLRAIARDLVGS
jgi:hypothetical protein